MWHRTNLKKAPQANGLRRPRYTANPQGMNEFVTQIALRINVHATAQCSAHNFPDCRGDLGLPMFLCLRGLGGEAESSTGSAKARRSAGGEPCRKCGARPRQRGCPNPAKNGAAFRQPREPDRAGGL